MRRANKEISMSVSKTLLQPSTCQKHNAFQMREPLSVFTPRVYAALGNEIKHVTFRRVKTDRKIRKASYTVSHGSSGDVNLTSYDLYIMRSKGRIMRTKPG